jgi:hypothetical protein
VYRDEFSQRLEKEVCRMMNQEEVDTRRITERLCLLFKKSPNPYRKNLAREFRRVCTTRFATSEYVNLATHYLENFESKIAEEPPLDTSPASESWRSILSHTFAIRYMPFIYPAYDKDNRIVRDDRGVPLQKHLAKLEFIRDYVLQRAFIPELSDDDIAIDKEVLSAICENTVYKLLNKAYKHVCAKAQLLILQSLPTWAL